MKEICWECTGAGNGIGILYCKVCGGTGYLEIKSENELIAKFMGLEWNTYEKLKRDYDSNWKELMPVISKIYNLMPEIKIPEDLMALREGTHPSDKYMQVVSLPISTPIEEVYREVVKFIKWYNQQNHGYSNSEGA